MLPDIKYYMTYEGSTTHPGCWETTVWIVLNKPIYITKREVSVEINREPAVMETRRDTINCPGGAQDTGARVHLFSAYFFRHF